MAFNLFTIEGGGAEHTREKVVTASARWFAIVADESKFVERLKHPVPVEVLPFAARLVERRLRALGGVPVLRLCGISGVVEHGKFDNLDELCLARASGVEKTRRW